MKTRFIFPFLLIASIICSCKKNNDTTEPRDTNFYITALKDNVAWSGNNAIALPYYIDTVEMRGYNTNETLKMRLKFTNTGKYTLTGTQGEYTLTTGGTQVLKKYKVRVDTVSSVNITSYDASTRIFEGAFELKLVQYYPVSANPDKLSFTNGKLRVIKAILVD